MRSRSNLSSVLVGLFFVFLCVSNAVWATEPPFSVTPEGALTVHGDSANVVVKQEDDTVIFSADANTGQTTIQNMTFSGPIQAPDGTAAAPGVTFANDTASGLYRATGLARSSSAQTITTSDVFGTIPASNVVCVNNGTARFAVAYNENTAVKFQLYAADFSPVGSAITIVGVGGATVSNTPVVAYDSGHNDLIIGWIDFTSYDVKVCRYNLTTPPTPTPIPVSGAYPTNYGLPLGLVVSDTGVIGVCWIATGSPYRVKATTVSYSGTVGAVVDVGVSYNYCAMTLSGPDTAIVCYNYRSLGLSSVYANNITLSTSTVSAPVTIENATGVLWTPNVAAIKSGRVLFVLVDGGGDSYIKLYENNITLPPVVRASLAPTTEPVAAVAACTSSFVVGWTEIATYQVNLNEYTTGGDLVGSTVSVASDGNTSGVMGLAFSGAQALMAYNKTISSTIMDVWGFYRPVGISVDGIAQLTLGADGMVTVPGSLSVAGTVYANQFHCTSGGGSDLCPSDQRIKTNIETINSRSCLDAVAQLRPIKYNFTPEYIAATRTKDVRQSGFIAQETAAIIPEVVRATNVKVVDLKDVQGITYERIVPYLAGAVKELKDRADALALENKKLEERLLRQQTMFAM